MSGLTMALICATWLAFGASAALLDKAETPKSVDVVAETLLSLALVGGGPIALLAMLLTRRPR